MNMVKLYDGGVYLVNGTEIVPKPLHPETYQKDTAKQGTIAYSILKSAQHRRGYAEPALKI